MFLLRPPNLLRRGPFFERKNVCNSQENGGRTRCAAIVNQPAVLKILRVVNLLRVVFLVRRGPCGEFLVFLSVFPFFSRDFRGSVGITNPCFFGAFPLETNLASTTRSIFSTAGSFG